MPHCQFIVPSINLLLATPLRTLEPFFQKIPGNHQDFLLNLSEFFKGAQNFNSCLHLTSSALAERFLSPDLFIRAVTACSPDDDSFSTNRIVHKRILGKETSVKSIRSALEDKDSLIHCSVILMLSSVVDFGRPSCEFPLSYGLGSNNVIPVLVGESIKFFMLARPAVAKKLSVVSPLNELHANSLPAGTTLILGNPMTQK